MNKSHAVKPKGPNDCNRKNANRAQRDPRLHFKDRHTVSFSVPTMASMEPQIHKRNKHNTPHIMRVHLAGCYKGQAQQTRDQSRSCPKSLSRRVSKRRPNHCAQRDPPCRFQRRLAGAFSAPIHSATTTADTGTPRLIGHAVRDFNLSCF